MNRLLIALATVALLHAQQTRPSGPKPVDVQRKLALVIGNTKYEQDPLTNPGNDAAAMARELRELKFDDVVERHDLTYQQITEEMNGFENRLRPGDLALFYYAGHGVQDDERRNYLVPVDFTGTQTDLPYKAYPANQVRDKLEHSGAKLRVIILDSCRVNTFRKASGRAADQTQGLSQMIGGEGTIIAYAAADNGIAKDGDGAANGLYTGKLLEAMRTPGLKLVDVFWRAKESVYQASKGEQRPAIYDSTYGDFYFLGSATNVTASAEMPKADAATEAWDLIKSSDRVEDFQDFAKLFPTSSLVGTAKLRAEQLRRAALRGALLEAAAPISSPSDSSGTRQGQDGLTYVWIRPGTFTMGCSAGDKQCFSLEKPAHKVTISQGFWMGKTPVTQAAYQGVMGANPSRFKGDGSLPVETVSWNDAVAYCSNIGMRLPTEAEWEYAARAGNSSPRYGDLESIAWYHDNSGSITHPVGQKQPNAWGLYDMLGNVWEWTADWFDDEYYKHSGSVDPAGPPSGAEHTLRGSTWAHAPMIVRVSMRIKYEPAFGLNTNVGLRCVGR